MKVITIWQPYATLLITDIKKYETRSWKTKHRGLIGIHAAKKPIKDVAKLLPEDVQRAINAIVLKHKEKKMTFKLGAIIGTAELIECHLINDAFLKTLTEEEKAMGDFTPVSYTHLRAHETDSYLVCRLLLE